MVDPKPVQKPHPPIWVAGNSPRTMKMTAEIADGWIPMVPPLTPDAYREDLGKILGWTIATLSKAARHLKLKGSIPQEFQLHRFISNKENVARLLGHAMEAVPPEAIDEFFVYGSPDDCIEGVERYLKAGVKHLIVAMFVRLKIMKETLRLDTEKVVPHFKEDK